MSEKLVVNFTTDELKKLVDDKTSCVTLHKSVYNIQLYPYHLSDIGASIKELLNAKVSKYDKKLDGILLGYKNLKLLTPQGSIMSDSCYIHIDIEGDFYIFKPEIDSLLTGVVNKRSDNHVGCLVHRLFNVSVPNTDEENWAGHNLNIADEVILRIIYIDLEARLPYIRAKIAETKLKTKKKTKIKKEVIEDDATDFQTQEDNSTKKIKKKRNKLKPESVKKTVLKEKIDTSLKKKAKQIKIEKAIKTEKTSSDKNGSLTNLNLDESATKKKKKPKLLDNKNKTEQDKGNNKLEKTKKRTSTEIKMNGYADSQEINALQTSEIVKLVKYTKIPKEIVMANAEDRKTKKRKSSINQNIILNKDLELYDSDLEKTLGRSPKSKAEESMKFNLVKIAALNESNEIKRHDKIEDKKEKKIKRKNSDIQKNEEQKPKKIKTEKQEPKEVKTAEIVKKNSKTKKNIC